jgi:hypothetical protein
MYMHRAWVVVDGDSTGVSLTERLRKEFQGWSPEHFQHWGQPAFELYYPSEFAESVAAVLAIDDRRKRKDEKRRLLLEVIAWIEEDEARAVNAFRQSAAEVIEILQAVERQIKPD